MSGSLDRGTIRIILDYFKSIVFNIQQFFKKSFSEEGVYFLTDTSAADTGDYYGFLVLTDTVVASISPIDSAKLEGDITAITLSTGTFISIPGRFSTITLTSGNIMLLRYI